MCDKEQHIVKQQTINAPNWLFWIQNLEFRYLLFNFTYTRDERTLHTFSTYIYDAKTQLTADNKSNKLSIFHTIPVWNLSN